MLYSDWLAISLPKKIDFDDTTIENLGASQVAFTPGGEIGSSTVQSMGLELDGDKIANSVIDTDGTLAANSDLKLAPQKAVKTYVDGKIAALADVVIIKGGIDCSANPNYPAADRGDAYKVTVAGKIGGGSGPNVQVNDTLICYVDGSTAGNHATVGANWIILQTNVDGALTTGDLGVTVQGYDADLAAIAALTTTAFGRSLLEAANAAALRTLAGTVIGTDVAPASATIITDLTTARTLSGTDLGATILMSNASAIAVTLPNSLPAGFQCTLVQVAAGAFTLAAASGATLREINSQTKSAGQWAVVGLAVITNAGGSAAEWVASGDTVSP